jgi:hypothetical protein
MSEQDFIADEDLDPETREALSEYTTARSDSGGVLWPRDEVPGEFSAESFPAESFPAEWEQGIERREAEQADDPDGPDVSAAPVDAGTEPARAPHITAEVRRRQTARLERLATKNGKPGRRSRWAHVPIASLFEGAGNVLFEQRDGTIETGHEPCHRSGSGRCVVVDPTRGVFWCRSCRAGGDAVTLLQQIRGWTRHQAVQHLTQAYGAPKRAARQSSSRQRASKPHRILEA